MDKSKLIPAAILAVSLIISSLLLSFSMSNLGDDIIAAGIHSRKMSLSHENNGSPLRIVVDKRSEIQMKTAQDSNE